MLTELDTTAIIVGLIFLIVLMSSSIQWISHTKRKNKHLAHQLTVDAWPIGWTNFGVLLCVMIISIFVVQVLSAQIIYSITSTDPVENINEGTVINNANNDLIPKENINTDEQMELTPWMAVWAVLSLQLPMLATFYGLRKLYPNHFAGQLNQHNQQPLTLGKAMSLTFPYFIRYLPIIWASSLIWMGLLTVLQKFGIIDDFSPQELIETFSKGDDFSALLLLAIFAVVLAPIVEEIIFRGAIYRFLKSQTTPLLAQVISGFFFAFMHGNLMSLIPLLIVGIFLARIYEQHGNILVPMCFHAYFNGFNLLLLLISSQSEIPFNY